MVVIPGDAPAITCLNGGTASADGRYCNCTYGSSGTDCGTCGACQNGGTRSSPFCTCSCPVGYFGSLCQEMLQLSCGTSQIGSNVTVTFDPSGAAGDANGQGFKTGDYVVLHNSSTADCSSSAVFLQLGGVGTESGYKK